MILIRLIINMKPFIKKLLKINSKRGVKLSNICANSSTN